MTNSSNPLDRDLVRKTMAGYAEVNRITDAERRARLATITDEEAWREYAELYRTWTMMGQRADGSWEEIEADRLAEKIALRTAFTSLAKALGLL